MAITRSASRPKWSEMPHELLVHIFAMLNLLERMTIAAGVCRSWRKAVTDNRKLVQVLDLSEYREIASPDFTYARAKKEINLAFVRGINMSGFQLSRLVFDPLTEIRDKHLIYAAQNCPNLKYLALPFPNEVKRACLKRCLQTWSNLTSFSIPFDGFLKSDSLFKLVGCCCPKLSELNVANYIFTGNHFKTLAKFMPSLELLSVRCVIAETNALVAELSVMPKLKEVYISCLLLQRSKVQKEDRDLASAINEARNLKNFPSLDVFHTCNWNETACQVPNCKLWVAISR